MLANLNTICQGFLTKFVSRLQLLLTLKNLYPDTETATLTK